jgi:hypothetical protein
VPPCAPSLGNYETNVFYWPVKAQLIYRGTSNHGGAVAAGRAIWHLNPDATEATTKGAKVHESSQRSERGRWRMDIEGQEERIHMSGKVAPVVIDKDGNPKPASQAVQRLAREIVERSGANSVEHFNHVVFGEVSFRDQTKEYLRWAGSRDQKRIKDLVSVEGALNKWILPVIGDLPLAKVNNITVKPLGGQDEKSEPGSRNGE